jgi:drug/metabolite transporter (DMT)-like permease
MTPIVLAAGAALLWGTSDFCGGKGSRRASALAVGLWSQLAGIPVLGLALLVVSGTPRATDLAWGAATGVVGLAAIVLLYHGLSQGAMTVVSPVTAVTAAVVPLTAGLVLDGPLSGAALAGVVAAVVAVALVSAGQRGPHGPVTPALVGLALASGTLFGLAFVLLGQVGVDSGMWPLAGLRAGALVAGLSLVAGLKTDLRLSGEALAWTALAGPLEVVGTACYLLAVTQGHLSVVAVLAALYPASTVLLALGVDRERLRLPQAAGLAFAAAALVLIAR